MDKKKRYTPAQNKASQKYQKANYKRIPFSIPLAFYDQIKTAAEAAGETVNGYIKKAILARMDADGQIKNDR